MKETKKENKRPREDVQDGFEEKVLFINRCSKVVKGGRKFSFSALILVGDPKRQQVGYGFAKANELTDAIRKGGEQARKNLISFEMEGGTIPHSVNVHWDGAQVLLKPAAEGTGVVAGSIVRSILEMAGVKDVVAKSLGASNPINLVRATFTALKQLRNRNESLRMRGMVA
ncbi:MAG: 30S ribosomal protein S5 [Verrucomicrobia bacterium]|nr:30S ribosomal protein S5 [Verrucomicrobiota bacterium]